jgi:hypothetical protein
MSLRLIPPAACLAALLLLVACGGGGGTIENRRSFNDLYDPTSQAGPPGTTSGGGGALSLFNSGGHNQQEGGGIGVNAYLWRGTLDTLKFMPLASADPFGGVIITDWYQPPTSLSERFKVTAYILGRQLRADGVRISVFRQVQQDGQWVESPVANGIAADLENRVLADARDLRAQATANQ